EFCRARALRAPANSDGGCSERIEFGHRFIRAASVTREDAESIVPLRGKAFDQLVLQVELPLLWHRILRRSKPERLLRIGGRLLPWSEEGVWPTRDQSQFHISGKRHASAVHYARDDLHGSETTSSITSGMC